MSTNKADLVLCNGNILTQDPDVPQAQMVAIRHGRILALGNHEEWHSLRASHTRLLDCNGKTIIPGFNDAHLHFFSLVSNLMSVDVSPAAIASIDDIRAAVAQQATAAPAGSWIKGAGYNEFYLREKRHPTRWDLDDISPSHPVKLTHRTRHALVLNSAGLRLAGITSQTPDPPGGLIERDITTGEPTGVIFGMNTHLAETVIPSPSDEEIERTAVTANRMLLTAGITAFQDATHSNGRDRFEAFRRIARRGLLQPHTTVMFGHHALSERIEIASEPSPQETRVRPGAIKIMVDEVSGRLNPPQDELNEMVLSVHSAGLQVAIHAVEASTVEAAVTAIEFALAHHPHPNPRHRIEHCSECPDHLLRRVRQAGITIVTQPGFIYFNGERYLSEVEPHRQPWLYRIGSLLNAGIDVAAGSDAPVIPFAPLIGIASAVGREARTGQKLLPDEGITAERALRIYTIAAARAALDGDRGVIIPGKAADLVVLSADPTTPDASMIRNIRVEKTIVGGEIVWETD